MSLRSFGRRALAFMATAGVGLLVVWSFATRSHSVSELSEAQVRLAKNQPQQALDIARQILTANPEMSAAVLVVAQSQRALGQYEAAIESLSQLSNEDPLAADARFAEGDIFLFNLRRLAPAEKRFRQALAVSPDRVDCHERLAYLYGLQARYWDQVPHRLSQIASGDFTTLELFSLALASNALENPELIMEYARADPNDPSNRVAAARIEMELDAYDSAEGRLRRVLERWPERHDARARLGQILVARNASSEELAEWQQAVPLNCANYPPLWYALALSHLHRSDSPSAIRCLWETLRLNPEHPRATYQLGQSLVGLGMERQAEAFLNLSRSLEAYVSACEVAHHLNEPSHLLSAAKLAEELGLPREAWGWAKLALQRSAQSPDALAIVTRSEARLAELDSVRMLPDHNPALTVDLSDLVPQTASSPSATGQRVQQARLNATVSFQDDAANAGLNFVYFNAGQPEQGLVYMYEVVGGGVGVLDYDRDGWPDMVFPQGAPWPLQPDQQASLDRLFRNRGDGRFVDVTSQACLFENGFSQGVSVGDFDDDGFPDLYVLNIQGNRLFHNNGDGTFTDVTARAGIAGDRYSVSGLIADLNGDSLPDIYTVNYLSGEELFTKVCADGQGRRGSCLPHLFLPSADRCFLNLGDGRFEDVTESSGIGQVSGMGLGIVAFRSQGDDGLNLFIANDIGPNFLFVNETGTDDRPLFVERGTVAGLAYNQLGQQEASMGIAAGDVDGDGRLDLFVTNFDDETNTLYRQRSGTLFEDATSEARLSRKTQPYVGWGTQFIDAELDGWPDLILTNGHVNDLRHLGKPFLMRSQFYRNLGAGRFVELTGDRLGEFFQQQRLGRGLARLDWNRDGREDVVISHLGSPAALLTNTTQGAGHALRIRLTATQSSRDAIGAIVTAQVGDQQLTMQLTAGDGNQSSNERQLVFGLNDATVADVVTVQWPSQAVQIFGPLSAGPVWLLVEGTEQAFDLP